MTVKSNALLSLLFTLIFSWAYANEGSGKNLPSENADSLQVTAPVQTDSVEAMPIAEASATKSESDKSILTKAEKDISVNLEAPKKSEADSNSIFKFILTFAILGTMGAGGYYFLNKKTRTNGAQKQATQIKVLSQHYLGPKKSLAIVRVAGESVLIGITDQNISMIKSLSLLDEDIPEETPKSFLPLLKKNEAADFAAVASRAQVGEANEDEFAVAGIKDFVSSKLKNMRSLE